MKTFPLLAGLLALLGPVLALAAVTPPPNLVVIMADDLGYGDLGGVWGGNARTPHLDRLAQEGLRFTDFHSSGPVCTPTRAALMTGRYPQRLGITKAFNHRYDYTGWESRGIAADHNRGEVTVAARLRSAGYVSGIFGKWHLGKHVDANPVRNGFDEFRGLTCGCGDYFSKLTRYGEPDWWHNDRLEHQEGYATTVTSRNAIRFIERHAGRPFFLYVPYSAIHFPWQGPEDGALPARREGRPVDRPGETSKVGPHENAGEVPAVARRMIEEMDAGIGRIVAALRQRGLERNTLVVFMSDNGGYNSYPYKGTRVAISSNGRLRGGKGQVYEGGHRVPAIAWWPGRIAAGRVTHQTAVTMDLVPTALELAGVTPPAAGAPDRLDGVSLVPLLLRDEPLPARTLFWQSPPGADAGSRKAVRQGPWKLVDNELYHLADDLAESRDLAAERPEIVRELKAKLAAWERDVMRAVPPPPKATAKSR
jgi:arylsulfatase A-like enzyme